ncbi:hypothetical protein HPB48_015794 [Haemaphysalis longicornis]|uniref:Uncharacterized protein n=1 Tax=Haemaphysalis longicornis TaxID=44386 RepID=A0A9J6GWF0_HAELO|nr:hypothetical protein HPB48_015794 [Haemaphysalis longicornis]
MEGTPNRRRGFFRGESGGEPRPGSHEGARRRKESSRSYVYGLQYSHPEAVPGFEQGPNKGKIACWPLGPLGANAASGFHNGCDPYVSHRLKARCREITMYDLVLENIEGSRNVICPDSHWNKAENSKHQQQATSLRGTHKNRPRASDRSRGAPPIG